MNLWKNCSRWGATAVFLLFLFFSLAACERPDPTVAGLTPIPVGQTPLATLGGGPGEVSDEGGGSAMVPQRPLPTRASYTGQPTPDAPHPSYNGAGGALSSHFVGAGETLGYIAQLYGSTVAELTELNNLTNANVLLVGQEIRVPGQVEGVTPNFKIIPDSELVYGPAAKDFAVRAIAEAFGGHLLQVGEEVEGVYLAGPEIVQLVAERYSVNPRLLLAFLEHRAGWLTRSAETGANTTPFLLGYEETNLTGLYRQLGRAANLLNLGFYGRAEGGMTLMALDDGTRLAFAADLNHGTTGVQNALGAISGATYESWQRDVGPEGFFATYDRLFGNPFAFAVEPLWPADLQQPPLQLPWANGETWYYTSGPHGGWASGSAWAALDFAPPGEQLGCVQSDNWVTAMADGLVVRSDMGAVVVDMDGDGYAGTGWAILYFHLESRDRIPLGSYVQTGDRLGYPSCEGGFSNGTHVHVARLYNGRWVSADGRLPLEMAGWVAEGDGREYNGRLVRGNVAKVACACRDESNAITAGE